MQWRSKNLPFYAFIIAFFIIMIGPYLLSHGMFMDGIMYATISNNLANGIGTMSDLAFTDTSLSHFREHPPLAFWIQSLCYKLFGNSFIIEKVYSALTYVITGIIIRKIWIRVSDDKSLAWLPLLFWISIPIITQAARNNLLENTMMIFTTSALYFLSKDKLQASVSSLALAGFMIYLGFMTKGFVALFLWSYPFWVYILKYNTSFKQFAKNTIALVGFTCIPFAVISLVYPSSFNYLLDYFNIQVSNSLQNVQTVESRFWIISKLIKELITPSILVILILLLSRGSKVKQVNGSDKKIALIFFLVGLSGVLPIIISLKQSGFYSVPAYAIIAISVALMVKTTY
jgi:4-amino-4-deoxy-L-arabinose transferase-like glycosyltransferase